MSDQQKDLAQRDIENIDTIIATIVDIFNNVEKIYSEGSLDSLCHKLEGHLKELLQPTIPKELSQPTLPDDQEQNNQRLKINLDILNKELFELYKQFGKTKDDFKTLDSIIAFYKQLARFYIEYNKPENPQTPASPASLLDDDIDPSLMTGGTEDGTQRPTTTPTRSLLRTGSLP
jgi:hypothetical protein